VDRTGFDTRNKIGRKYRPGHDALSGSSWSLDRSPKTYSNVCPYL